MDTTTLVDVLSFLAAVDSDNSLSERLLIDDVARKPPTEPKRDRRRKTGPVPYSTTLQRRKKDEISKLRLEVQQLTVQLVDIQQRRQEVTAVAKGSSGWRRLAAAEGEERHRAEQCNRELRAILANQQRVNDSIWRLLSKRDALIWRELVRGPRVDRPPAQFDLSKVLLGALASSLGSLRIDARTMFPPPANDQAIVCKSRTRPDATGGQAVVETITTTPLECSIQEADKILWGFVSSDIDTSFDSIKKQNPNPSDMTSLATSREGLLCINGVTMYRRYEEADRIIVVGMSTWMLPSGSLQFEDRAWTVISASPVDPLHQCVVQTRYQLQAKVLDQSVRPADFIYARDAVMDSIGKKLRNAMQSLQSALLDEVAMRPAKGTEM